MDKMIHKNKAATGQTVSDSTMKDLAATGRSEAECMQAARTKG